MFPVIDQESAWASKKVKEIQLGMMSLLDWGLGGDINCGRRKGEMKFVFKVE
jgi:hypothetical protein